jgi:hypothetical protein
MMRRAIAEQVKEKQARLDAEREEETKRSTRFKRVVNTLEAGAYTRTLFSST